MISHILYFGMLTMDNRSKYKKVRVLFESKPFVRTSERALSFSLTKGLRSNYLGHRAPCISSTTTFLYIFRFVFQHCLRHHTQRSFLQDMMIMKKKQNIQNARNTRMSQNTPRVATVSGMHPKYGENTLRYAHTPK